MLTIIRLANRVRLARGLRDGGNSDDASKAQEHERPACAERAFGSTIEAIRPAVSLQIALRAADPRGACPSWG
jgi:hypothetical protein